MKRKIGHLGTYITLQPFANDFFFVIILFNLYFKKGLLIF